MTGWWVAFSIRHRALVIIVAAIMAVAGEYARRHLAKDALPDLSDPRISLVAEWMGHSAPEVSTTITSKLTVALGDVPGATAVRGTSMSGMGFVDTVFRSASDLDGGRREIEARVDRVRDQLPANARVRIGPLASSTGWVFEYALIDPERPYVLAALRRFQEDVLRPALASLPGVAEIATVGAGTEQLLVEVKPSRLATAGLAFGDLVPALRRVVAGSPSPTVENIGAIRVAGSGDVALRDLGRVRVGPDMPTGVADYQGAHPAIGGIVVARSDADVVQVIAGVREVLERASADLPPGARIVTVYDRSDLSARVEHTLLRALAEEIAAVLAVVLIFLLHGRCAAVPLVTLPLVVLLTFGAMWLCGIPATVMSVGGIGIALGMAVDADVVALEACARRLEHVAAGSGVDRRGLLVAAAASFTPAILSSLLIAALAFLPVLAFTGESGRLLQPLALTKTFVILAAALVSSTLAPVLRDVLLGGRVVPEFANPLTRTLVRLYAPFVRFALERPFLTLLTASLMVLSCLPLLPRLGGEFLPRLDEGDLLFMPSTLPGVPLEDAEATLALQDRVLSRFPEVASVFGKVGRADTATDPAPLSMIETVVRLRPKEEWPRRPRARWYSTLAPAVLKPALGLVWPESAPLTTAELTESLDHKTRRLGWTSAWTAPARARMDMITTGVRTPVGVRIVSRDLARVDTLGTAVRAIVERVPGTRSAVYESLGGETFLGFDADASAIAGHGADPTAVDAVASLVLTGGELGVVPAAGRWRRLRLVQESVLRPADRLSETTIRAGRETPPIPLGFLGRPVFVRRPAVVRSERAESVAYVYVDLVEGTDPLGYVERAERAIADASAHGELGLDADERLEWTGQYELLVSGRRRLTLIVPLVAFSMLGLLVWQFRNFTEAAIVLSSVPFALAGSVWTLFLFGFPLSAPVWVGLLSVVGLAMQTGVVMVVYIDEAFHRRVREGRLRTRDDIVAAHAEGSIRRLRPKVMTVTTMAAGLLPLVWAEGAGAEIMRRVAAPMLGGLATSAFLTLEVLPVLYTIWRHRQLLRAERLGRPLAEIVGRVPPWAV